MFAIAALVVGTIGEMILARTYFSDTASKAAIAFARSSPQLAATFGEIRDVVVVSRTEYSNGAADHRREHEFVLSVSGGLANGTVDVVDIAPDAGSRYVIGEIDAHPPRQPGATGHWRPGASGSW